MGNTGNRDTANLFIFFCIKFQFTKEQEDIITIMVPQHSLHSIGVEKSLSLHNCKNRLKEFL